MEIATNLCAVKNDFLICTTWQNALSVNTLSMIFVDIDVPDSSAKRRQEKSMTRENKRRTRPDSVTGPSHRARLQIPATDFRVRPISKLLYQ